MNLSKLDKFDLGQTKTSLTLCKERDYITIFLKHRDQVANLTVLVQNVIFCGSPLIEVLIVSIDLQDKKQLEESIEKHKQAVKELIEVYF